MRKYVFDGSDQLPEDALHRLAAKHGCRCVIGQENGDTLVMFVAPAGFFTRDKAADIGIGMNTLQLIPKRRGTLDWYDGE